MSLPSTEKDAPINGNSEKFSIVLPVHNGADSLERVLKDFYEKAAIRLGAEILVCEDGSSDGTPEVLHRVAEKLPFGFVSESRRLGYAQGVKRGLRLAKGDTILFSDSDGQYLPEDFGLLLDNSLGFDMVIGMKVKRDESPHRIILSKGFHLLVKILFGIKLHDIDCGFRLVRRHLIHEVLDSVCDLPFSFWAEFTILSALRGYKIAEVPISHRNRLHGSTTIYQPNRLPRIVLAQLLGLLHLRRRIGS